MVTVLPTIVATLVLLLVYVNAPELLLVGVVNVNGAAPINFEGTLKPVMFGVVSGFQK
jgi:hypothetical protein